MPFSHHSHSGQFCGHAIDTLEEVVRNAISKGMTIFCMTEHMPREKIDFYPEEADVHNEASLVKLYDDFYTEARRLQETYKSQITLFVGFEGEWIRPSSRMIIHDLLRKYAVDIFVGSVHHVHTIPIDFDTSMYHQARDAAGGTDEAIFADYFDSQFEMLKTLEPPVVGHFDLIRLKSDDPERSFKTWPAIWKKILRNLRCVIEYGGVLELNSSSLRKGMSEPYPKVEICQVSMVRRSTRRRRGAYGPAFSNLQQEFHAMGGRFTLSDDSHGTSQVGLNFARTLQSAREAGVAEIFHVAAADGSEGSMPLAGKTFSHMCWKKVAILELCDGIADQK